MITSVNNPQIKNLVKLRKAGERRRQGLILIEGFKELSLALSAGLEIVKVYYSKELSSNKAIAGLAAHIEPLDKKLFSRISYRDNPDGWLGLARPRYLSLEQIKLARRPLIIVLERIEKPGNLGAILRTADAVGADAVIACEEQTDIYNPNVIRSSLGSIFTKQIALSSNSEVIKWLEKNKISIFASSPEAKMKYIKANYRVSSAIVIGAEHDGLSQEWLKAADVKIRIPMHGQVDSLNASVSAAIILYEAARQRV